MGRTRQSLPQSKRSEQTPQEGQYAELIAGLLAGVIALPDGMTLARAVAAVLGSLRLLTSLERPQRSLLSEAVAALVVAGIPEAHRRLEPSPARALEIPPLVRQASGEALIYRARYAIAALRRLATEVAEPGGKTLGEALAKERNFYARHREAQATREKAAQLNAAAAERWGPVLHWNHTATAKTHRPTHVAAGGHNFDIRRRPITTGGALPAEEPNCDCLPGPPVPGAPMLR